MSDHQKVELKLMIDGLIGVSPVTKIIKPKVPIDEEYIRSNVQDPNTNWRISKVIDIFLITETSVNNKIISKTTERINFD
tara:strand:- start:736 stop:975 length:240 start_codon:yes stop_codon:yes gene_type:complete